jgi:hypothetical protein
MIIFTNGFDSADFKFVDFLFFFLQHRFCIGSSIVLFSPN